MAGLGVLGQHGLEQGHQQLPVDDGARPLGPWLGLQHLAGGGSGRQSRGQHRLDLLPERAIQCAEPFFEERRLDLLTLVQIRNEGEATMQFRLYMGDYDQAENGDYTFIEYGNGPASCSGRATPRGRPSLPDHPGGCEP